MRKISFKRGTNIIISDNDMNNGNAEIYCSAYGSGNKSDEFEIEFRWQSWSMDKKMKILIYTSDIAPNEQMSLTVFNQVIHLYDDMNKPTVNIECNAQRIKNISSTTKYIKNGDNILFNNYSIKYNDQSKVGQLVIESFADKNQFLLIYETPLPKGEFNFTNYRICFERDSEGCKLNIERGDD